MPARAVEEWHDEEHEGDESDTAAWGLMGTCRGTLRGALQRMLKRRRDGALVGDDEEDDEDGAASEALTRVPNRDVIYCDGLYGALPHRAMQLSPAAAATDLHLGFTWHGNLDLQVMCLLLRRDSDLVDVLWSGHRGSLQAGAELTPKGLQHGLGEDKAACRLRFPALPAEAYACAFALVASGTPLGQHADGLLRIKDAAVHLRFGPRRPHLWRSSTHIPQDRSNTWLCAIFYRGPGGSWRLEPLLARYMIMAFQYAGTEDDESANQAAAQAIAVKLRWFIKDRCWEAACQERKMPIRGPQ